MKTQFVFFVIDFLLVSAYLLVLIQQNMRKVFAKVGNNETQNTRHGACLLYTSPSPRDRTRSRMPSSA